MTLLTIIQNTADRLGLDRPSDVIGSSTSDALVRQLLALANEEGKDLSDARNWTAQQTEYTFTTTALTASYALPSDFKNFLNDTQWDRQNHWALIGPISPQEWQMIKSGIVTVGPRRRFRLMGSSSTTFKLDPTPGATDGGQTLVFEYASKNWCQSAAGAGQQAWAADTDTGILDEELMTLGLRWRFMQAKGMDYLDFKKSYDNMVRIAGAQDGGAPVLTMAPRRRLPYLIGPANIPEAGFGS